MSKKKRISRKKIFEIISEIQSEILDLRRKSIFTFNIYNISNISGFAAYSEKFFTFASEYFRGLNYDYESPHNSEEVWFWLWHPASGVFANDLIENLPYYTDKGETELEQMNEIASEINKKLDIIESELQKIKNYLLK